MTKHTPGPWNFKEHPLSGPMAWDRKFWVCGKNGHVIASVPYISKKSPYNAALIAAAPEMLEALEAIGTVLDRSESDPRLMAEMLDEISEIQKTIAKAK